MDDGLLFHSDVAQEALTNGLDASRHCEIRIGHGKSALLALENAWRALSATLPEACFIHDFDWQWLYLQHLAQHPEAVLYVSFFANGEAVAIFPLRRIRRSIGRLHLYLWELPSHKHLALCDPLISPAWTRSGLLRCLRQVLNAQAPQHWDALHFHGMLDNSLARRLFTDESPALIHIEPTGCSMYFVCKDIDSALARCSSEFWRNLRRQERKLAGRGAVSVVFARQGTELEAAFTDFLRLEASGWKGCEGKASAIACHPELIGFYSEMKDRFAATDSCLIALLCLDGVAIAAQLCLRSGRTLYIQKIAYDEARRAEAPGSQLLLRLIEHACANPDIDRVSLVTGPAWAAGRWKPDCSKVWEGFVFNSTPRGISALLIRRLKTRVIVPGLRLWQRVRGTPAPAAAVAPGRPS